MAADRPPSVPRERLRAFFRDAVRVLVLTTLVGLAMALMGSAPLLHNLVYSWSIGLSILGVSYLLGAVSYLLGASDGIGRTPVVIYVLGVPLGGLIGVLAGTHLNGSSTGRLLAEHPDALITAAVGALVFGTAITYYFYARERLAEGERRAQAEAARQAQYEQRLAETELRLLQAQIEPHFLFNTLANVQALIGSEPARAEAMLQSLTQLLRSALRRSRASGGSLGDELALVEAYLAVHAVRMGARLTYGIDCEPGLEATPLPPLLIQPLVENAIRHGLEPKPRGGRIEVRASRAGGALVVEVADTGRGLDPDTSAPAGLGLRNVRQRLEALHGSAGRIDLLPNQPAGLRARLRLPLESAR